MSAAMQAVFGTAELLENILTKALLQGMSHRELLLAQRVSPSWKGTIEGSPLLQKALFFRPVTSEDDLKFYQQWYSSEHYRRDATLPPANLNATEPSYRSLVFLIGSNNRCYEGFGNCLAQEPLLPRFVSKHGARDPRDFCNDTLYQQFLRGALSEGINRNLARCRREYELWSRPESSVHRMLVCQPPAIAVEIILRHDGYQDPARKTFHARSHAVGVKAGDVFRHAVQSGVGGGERCGYYLEEPHQINEDVTGLLRRFNDEGL